MYKVRDIDADIYLDCPDATTPEGAVMEAVMDFAMTFPSATNFHLEVEQDGEVIGNYEALVEIKRVVTCKEL